MTTTTNKVDIKLKATKKPEDFDGSTSSLNTSGLPRKPTVSTSFSPVAVARLKTIKKPEDYDGSTSSLNTTGMPVKSAVTEEAMLSSTSPYGLARLKTVVKESPTKPTPSPTVESPFAVTLKSTKKPQDYQELVQKPQFKTKFEQSQAQAEISKEKEIPKKTVMPAKIVKLKDPNTITVTNASFVPPKLKSAQPLAHLPTQSTLYILKGLRKIYITPVTTITPTDSYVYVDKDTKTVSYWGTGAVKKVKGRDYAGRFERQFKGLKTLNEQTQVKFETGEEVDDGLWESEFEKEIKLWKFDVGSEKIGEGRVSCTLLDDNFVYGLESRDGVYIWQGSLSLAQIRDDAREWADKVKGARNVYVQSAQDTMLLFRDKFTDWSEGMSIAVSQTKNIGAADRTWANYHRAQSTIFI